MNGGVDDLSIQQQRDGANLGYVKVEGGRGGGEEGWMVCAHISRGIVLIRSTAIT